MVLSFITMISEQVGNKALRSQKRWGSTGSSIAGVYSAKGRGIWEKLMAEIKILTEKIDKRELKRLVEQCFKDMVKYVVDVRQRRIAIGGELHADAEQLLLESGSEQKDIWGANYYPGKGESGCIEYTALINIRPSSGNSSMEVVDNNLQEKIREITFELIGKGKGL